MKWFILFFVFALMAGVFAETVEVQVENVSTDTQSRLSSQESSSFGYVLMALGVLVLLFMLFTMYMSRNKKKLHLGSLQHHGYSLHRPLKRDLLSWFLRKEKSGSKVLSHAHYAPIEQHSEQEDMEEKTAQFMSLKDDIAHEYPKVLDEEIRNVLKVTDDLLGELPEEKVDTFVHSPTFEVYKKVMKKVHEPLRVNAEQTQNVQRVLELFEKGVVDADEARKMLGLPVRHLHIVKTEKKDKAQVLDELKKVRHEN